MEESIKNIIKNAKNMKRSQHLNDYEVAEFIHYELGKNIYYDNNYTAKLQDDNKETDLSYNRKKNLLHKNTDMTSKAQICKGMAEIYADILNNVGIEAKAIGIEKKGDIQEVSNEDAKHFCTVFKIENQEYVQDYLMESALMRIKIGEANFSKNMPGICPINEYSERGQTNIMQTQLSTEFIKKVFGEELNSFNDKERLELIFEKLNGYFKKDNMHWGFEEAKDFVLLMGKDLIKNKSNISFINLVNESENKCGVACVYKLNGEKYLVRGNEEISDIKNPIGKISDNDLQILLESGYEGRSSQDRENLQLEQAKQKNTNKIILTKEKLISMAKDENVALEAENSMEDIAKLERENEREVTQTKE